MAAAPVLTGSLVDGVRLAGPWRCRLLAGSDPSGAGARGDGGTGWRAVEVPGSWEETGIAKDMSGPVEYHTTVDVPAGWAGRRVWLRFGAVSYACVVSVDGREAGRHVGMWDPFDLEVTDLVTPGRPAEVTVRVSKPASLTAGPDSPPVPGEYPQRETLAGFLPYVWGHSHGGIWQPVRLLSTGPVTFGTTDAWGTPDGALHVRADLAAGTDPAGDRDGDGDGDAVAEVAVTVTDPDGTVVAERTVTGRDRVAVDLIVPDPRPWSPDRPARYTVRLRLAAPDGRGGPDRAGGPRYLSDERTLRIGLRALTVDGSLLRLNGDPLYPRMVLSWGWYPDRLHPDPGPDRVRADLTELRRLGFNGVKLCLWYPPPYYFEIADELGMLLWLELPMWLPHPTEHFRAQLFTESRALVRAAANHPSVILYTLGCELGAAVGADVLGPLYDTVKRLVHDGLVRDNSGSGEAYGGLLDEFADFDDHHFYCEPGWFRPVLDHFAPQWRDPRPWLFGEFGDLDTFRDLDRIARTAVARHADAGTGDRDRTRPGGTGPGRPWWTSSDPAVNPQGARWQYDVHEQDGRLAATEFAARGAELERISYRQAVLHRKVTLEAVRSRPDTSGYVITGERDTPISTAGLWDDTGRLKVDAGEFAAFNSDLVLALGWDRRRAWVAGGDRPAPWDTWCHQEGATVRAHLLLAHHAPGEAAVRADWEVGYDGLPPFATGRVEAGVPAGTVRRLGVAAFPVPRVSAPGKATLRVRATVDTPGGTRTTTNSWPLWLLPADAWAGAGPVALVDPAGRLAGLADLVDTVPGPVPGTVAVATAWTGELRRFVASGGSAILLLDRASGVLSGVDAQPPGGARPDLRVPLVDLPFWREAVKVIEPHPAWGDFPHEGWTDLQFAGMAPDLAMDTRAVPAGARPLLRRVDARTMAVHDYATEVRHGSGRVLLSTLRFEGSRGDQPLGLRRNTGAGYLLSRWVRALRG